MFNFHLVMITFDFNSERLMKTYHVRTKSSNARSILDFMKVAVSYFLVSPKILVVVKEEFFP